MDHSIAPEILAVFQLFFNSYHVALGTVDDEDFFADKPIATADAKAMAMSLRSVVIKSMAAPALSPAWEAGAFFPLRLLFTSLLTSVVQYWMLSLPCCGSSMTAHSGSPTSTPPHCS